MNNLNGLHYSAIVRFDKNTFVCREFITVPKLFLKTRRMLSYHIPLLNPTQVFYYDTFYVIVQTAREFVPCFNLAKLFT